MANIEVANKRGGSKILLNTAALVIIIAGMREASSILVILLLALFMAILFLPLFSWLNEKGVPPALSLIAVLFIMISLGTIVLIMIGSSLATLKAELPFYEQRLNAQMDSFMAWMQSLGANIPEKPLMKPFELHQVMGLMQNVISSLASTLSNTLFIILVMAFILLEASGFPAKLKAFSQDPEVSISSFYKTIDNVKRYMAFKSLISLGTGICVSVILLVLGINFPVMWGLLAFLFNFIPNIGSLIAAIPAVLLAFVQFGPGTALLTMGGYLLVNFIFGNVLEPRLMGEKLGLSTLVVFVSLFFWGWVLGPVGMLLSVPLTMSVKIILDSHESTRRMAILLDSSPKSVPV